MILVSGKHIIRTAEPTLNPPLKKNVLMVFTWLLEHGLVSVCMCTDSSFFSREGDVNV